MAARPDVAVVDMRLPDGDGIELCRDLLAASTSVLRCVLLTSYPSEATRLLAARAGIAAYIAKDITGMHLTQTVRDVAAGIKALGADHSRSNPLGPE